MFKRLLLSSALLAAGLTSPVYAACEQAWSDLLRDASLGSEARVQRWRELGPDCGGDAAYAHRLAFVYARAAMFDQAEKVLEQAIEKYVEPGDLTVLEYDLIDVERARLFDAGTPDKAAIMELIAKFVAHTEKYQSSALGYSAAAELYLLMAEPAKAAEFSQKAVAIEPDYLAFRTLSIAQANLEKYEEAVDSAISASQFNPGFRGDIGLMMSAAYSFIGMGDIDNAKAALGALMQERPDVKQHEEFNQLLVFVYEKAEQLESQVE